MHRRVRLSDGSYCLISASDFPLVKGTKWHRTPGGYVRGGEFNNYKFMHRVILQAEPGQHVDHINKNGLDNRRENIRLCSTIQNLACGRGHRNKASRLPKGVFRSGNRYRSSISIDNERIHLGYYERASDAEFVFNAIKFLAFAEFSGGKC